VVLNLRVENVLWRCGVELVVQKGVRAAIVSGAGSGSAEDGHHPAGQNSQSEAAQVYAAFVTIQYN
jgi:hypothetical protein